jgi:hypothetical protein
MTTQMVRKQIYIKKRQEALLKSISQARGLSEAEIIRQAIDREISGRFTQPAVSDRSAWQEIEAFLEARRAAAGAGQPYRWDRQEIYSEREDRWLRDRDEG